MSIKMYEGGDQVFHAACSLAGIKNTRRQYRKWGQKRGQAYARKTEALNSRDHAKK